MSDRDALAEAAPRRVDCENCGMSNARCWARIERRHSACCGACGYTETHPARAAAGDQPEGGDES